MAACPICTLQQRPAASREHLSGGFEVCGGCGFAIRLDERGELVEWATTNRSHPRGIWGRKEVRPGIYAVVGRATPAT